MHLGVLHHRSNRLPNEILFALESKCREKPTVLVIDPNDFARPINQHHALARAGKQIKHGSRSQLQNTLRVAWKGGGAHFIMVVGGGPNDMVLVKDPIYGLSYISYATLSGSYQGSGTWTHSYFTQA